VQEGRRLSAVGQPELGEDASVTPRPGDGSAAPVREVPDDDDDGEHQRLTKRYGSLAGSGMINGNVGGLTYSVAA
jgi:hypothetical protein